MVVWTSRLISEIETWSGRKYSEINFYLSQFFTGHEVFESYLKRLKPVDDNKC